MNHFILPAVFVFLVTCNCGISINVTIDDQRASLEMDFYKILETKCNMKNASKLFQEANNTVIECIKNSNSNSGEYSKNIDALKEYNNNSNRTFLENHEFIKKLPYGDRFCNRQFFSTIDVCLDDEAKEIINISMNVYEVLRSFYFIESPSTSIIHNRVEYDRCQRMKSQDIFGCYESLFTQYVPSNETTLNRLPAYQFEEKQCKSMSQLKTCVVAELKKCSDPTQVNFYQSFIDIMCQLSPCSKFNCAQLSEQNSPMEDTPKNSPLITAIHTIFALTYKYIYLYT